MKGNHGTLLPVYGVCSGPLYSGTTFQPLLLCVCPKADGGYCHMLGWDEGA